MEATKIYETSDSTLIRGKTIELLTEDLQKQRDINLNLQEELGRMNAEIGLLKYIEGHIKEHLEHETLIDEDHLSLLFSSLKRIRGMRHAQKKR